MPEINVNDLKKLYYTMGEVAKIFEVNPSLIRFWEKEFAFSVSKKNKKGNRLFSVADIQHFNKIYHLVKEKGFTLEGAKKELNKKTVEQPLQQFDKEELIKNLEDIKSKLIRLKK